MISVIIPTYNRCASLERAIHSVLSQKNAEFELIVVDDGSTDGTRDLIHQIPQINYLHQNNRGVSAARNFGIKHAHGEWIAFLDSDDEWLPGKLAAQVQFFEENPSIKICQTNEIWIRKGVRVNPMKKHAKKGGWIFEHCLPLCAISPSSVMMHRSLFEQVGLFDESYPACEDYELWLRIASRYEVGLIEKDYLKKYGGHEDQLSQKHEAMDRFRVKALSGILASGILNSEQKKAAEKTLREKLEILEMGAKKHNNSKLLTEINPLLCASKEQK